MSEETIHVSSMVTRLNRDPMVQITWGEVHGIIGAQQARNRGLHLLEAVAIALAEEGIFKTLVPNAKPYKGFGKYNPVKDLKMAMILVEQIRKKNQFNHPDIEPIYGAKHQKGLISYKWNSQTTQLDLTEATNHAYSLIIAAEAAENDSFFYSFFGKMDNENESFSQTLMNEYRLFKKQKTFEQLFNEE